ncbi:Guanine nucleotide exchange factor for Rab-3A [Lamellibrachia satsuma]|nr:Guanine nucleotide exchange factor for Rab-3A [Lamellibrachia satsuma]
MVQDANIRRMQSEKLLKEANAKIDVLQAEVTALKTLVITSTPSMPNKHLHPQLEPKKDVFVKGHRRSTSHHNFSKEMRLKEVTFLQEAPPEPDRPIQREVCSVYELLLFPLPLVSEPDRPVQRELDPVNFEEFRCWKVMPTMAQSCVFLSRIISEDVLPCLGFTNRELARSVFECVMDNSLTIEPVPDKHPSPGLPLSADDPSCKCALVNSNCACKYRIKLDNSEQWYFISQLARNRITAVCDFMTYIRYITQGLVKSDVRNMYWEIIRLRQQMALARLGLS